jgi:dethiobiotin synthetase
MGAAAGMSPEEVSPLLFGPAVSPHLAAQLARRQIEPVKLIAVARRRGDEGTLVVEGVGGLLVPLSDSYTVLDLAIELALPLVIAARPGLGTINHTLLTLGAARERGLDVPAVVLTPWPSQPSEMERSNRETIARLGEVEVQTLAPVESANGLDLAHAGAALPWQEWMDRSSGP